MPRRGFLRQWTFAFAAGELVGFVPPAAVGAWLGFSGAGDAALILGLVLAGAVEGAAIGTAQAWVLAHHGAGIRPRSWVLATALGAAVAWFVGMGGAAVGQRSATPLVLLLLVPAWVAGLAAMGLLQWRLLRRVSPHALRWVPVSSAAWLVGVLIPVAAISLSPDRWPVAAHVGVAVAAAVAMGLLVGLVTGRTMGSILTRRSEPSGQG